jgi:FAD dependent oxidoreductase TIGR03364
VVQAPRLPDSIQGLVEGIMADGAGAEVVRPDWDLIVVGAGVLGSFHAYFAARRGWRTLLLERGDWPGKASVRNFGTLVPGAMSPGEWHRRGLESVRVYRELADQVPLVFSPCGTMYAATTPGELAVVEEFASLGPAKGYRCELLDAGRVAAANPLVNAEAVRAVLFFPDDARVEPRGLFRRFIPWMVRELGVAYRPATVAVRVTARAGEARVLTAGGSVFAARHAIVCGGADLRTLFPERFAAAGLLRCKLLMLRTAPQPEARLPVTLASGLTLRRYASFRLCPAWGRLAGEAVDAELTRCGIHVLIVQDADGSLVVGDSHTYSVGDLDEVLDVRAEELILREAARLARPATWRVAERWHGVYSLPPQGELFRQSIDGVIHLVTGIGGKGMTTGPAVARETIDALAGAG